MFRWTILIGTLVVWLACMLLVYQRSRPAAAMAADALAQERLEALFDENAEMERGWWIYVDTQRLNTSEKSATVMPGWLGTDELKLTHVGWIKTVFKKRGADETRMEQVSDAEIRVPQNGNIPPMFKMFSPLRYRCRAEISRDTGLETVDAVVRLAESFTIVSHGVRDGNELRIMQQIFQQQKKLFDQSQRLPMSARAAPTTELMPFQPNKDVRKGAEWTLYMLDTGVADIASQGPPRVIALKAHCTGQRYILHDKRRVAAFEAVTEDGRARAWYSADGVVLKQTCKLADMLDVVMVRIDPKDLGQLGRPNSAPDGEGAAQ